MSLLPDWMPNVHPLVIHFPIALLFVAVAVDLGANVLRKYEWLPKTATLLYTVGAVFAFIAYLTGKNAADNIILPAAANLVLNEHADLGKYTFWFFSVLAIARIGLLALFKDAGHKISIPLLVFGLIGLRLLQHTAEHGGQLVYGYGVGVTVTQPVQEEVVDITAEEIDPGIIESENNSWAWRPIKGAPKVLDEQFTFVEGNVTLLSPDMYMDDEKGEALSLNPGGEKVLFVAGNDLASTQIDLTVNISGYNGRIMIVYHLKDSQTYDFLSFDSGIQKLGRIENGTEKIWQQGNYESKNDWIAIRVFGGGGHFRSYADDVQITHGHDDDLPDGKAGLLIEGTGRILIKDIQVQAIK